ncbi:hypothetical protein L9F63_016524 [Diploptera punctata]|uniref:Prokaryotic-type class I peptide chain release factors domain-containing protein n=1 Tax=Diploptera punctata TaxID=6984 RepID=A0AAD8A139_DIPPU|nr:hypothetical protein L9F63_016524 [Diploptera punctata]
MILNTPTPRQVLRLYRDLLRYGKQLQFTDKGYFCQRIRKEFKQAKSIENKEDINFYFEKMAILILHARQQVKLLCLLHTNKVISCNKHTLDSSRVPKLNEDDLDEQFVRGSGPGGQAVNKTNNCVVLQHKPTGIVVKCHHSRLQDENRKLAREMLITKLDNLLNGKLSIDEQKKAIQEKKSNEKARRQRKLRELKAKWKENEGIT